MSLFISSTQIILIVSGAGVIQAILLAGLLYYHPKSDKSVNIFLALHLLTMSIFMLMPVVQQIFSWQAIIILIPFQFLIGPFLYLYVRSFKERITWRKAWPHFILFLLSALTNYYLYTNWVYKYPVSGEVPAEVLLHPNSYIPILIRNIQMLTYFFLSQRALTSYQKSINHLYSETSKINLSWVRRLINGFLFLIISVLVLVYFVFTYPEKFDLLILINTAIITPYIYLVTFKGISQVTLWQIQPDKSKTKVENEIIEVEKMELLKKEEKQIQPGPKGLPEIKLAEIISRIISLMEKDKIFQEPELTLQTLSDKTGIPSYQVSQAINDGLNKNFYDLINGYRVEEAKRLLVDLKNRNYTILSVGFEAGFNSKTTFNTVFKKFTGLTPTEFRDKKKLSAAAG